MTKLGPFFHLSSSSLPKVVVMKASRPSTTSKPNIRKNIVSLHHNLDDIKIKHAQKVIEAKQVLIARGMKNPLQGLVMVDTIQRLGIESNFVKEIQDILESQYKIMSTDHLFYDRRYVDLYEFSLRFRLLRQQGYFLPQDVFNRFMNNDKFKEVLGQDVWGLMELYEAAHLSIPGDNILDEARKFTIHHLEAWLENRDDCQARVVKSRLDHPYHTSFSRFVSKKQLMRNNFSHEDEWGNIFQQVAKYDFDMAKSLHKNEVSQISRWWRDLDLPKELKLRRKQPLTFHLWSMGCLPDLSLSQQRIDCTKYILFIYIIDDIFDAYATLDELNMFNEAINKWDCDSIEQLPEYMKVCFMALDNVINEMSYAVFQRNGWNPVDSLRKTWVDLCNAFLVEAKWFASGQFPETNEYLKNGIMSSGVQVTLVHAFFLLDQSITKQNVQLLENNPTIISSTSIILRLWDDLESLKEGNKDEYDASYLECYIKEHKGSTMDEARKEVKCIISDSWKQLNQECLSMKLFSKEFETACLNFTRMVRLMYNSDDKDRFRVIQEYMKSLLVSE